MDDVIKLISSTFTLDEVGNQIPSLSERQVFCQVQAVGRAEFYSAAQLDLHPEYVFVLSNFRDYGGEKLAKYKDWTGTEKVYGIIRTYRPKDSDAIELTAQERIGNG